MFRAFSVGSVIAFACLLLLPLQACATPAHVVLWPIHGAILGGANCPASAVYPDDGCTGAPADGFFKAPNFFSATANGYVSTGANYGDELTEANQGLSAIIGSGIARQSPIGPEGGCGGVPCASGGNTANAYKALPPFDVAGVGFAIAYSTGTIASQSHPEGAALPGGWRDPLNIHVDQPACNYAPTGNSLGGAQVNCIGGANLDIEGYDFGAHGCTVLYIDGAQTGTTKIKNNRWIVGPGCITPLDGNGSNENIPGLPGGIAGSPGGAYIKASMGEAYPGYIHDTLLCTGTPTQGSPQIYPGYQSEWIIEQAWGEFPLPGFSDGTYITGGGTGQGACAAGYTAWTLAWDDIRSSSSPDFYDDGSNNWKGYITGNTMCVQTSTLVGNVVVNDFIQDDDSGAHTGKKLIPYATNPNGIVGTTQITVNQGGQGACASGFSAYTVSFVIGSSSSPTNFTQRSKRLHVTQINSGGIIGLGVGNATQGAQKIQADNNGSAGWTNGIGIDACVGGSVNPSTGITSTVGTCGVTGDYVVGWKYGAAHYYGSQGWVVGNSVNALIDIENDGSAPVDFEQNYIDGFDTRYPYGLGCGNGSALCIHNTSTFTLKYNAILRVNGRALEMHAQTTDFEDNYIEGLGINGVAVHAEVNINGNPGATWSTQNMTWVNNTILVTGDQETTTGGTAPVWAKNPSDSFLGNPTTTAITVKLKYNTIVDNANQFNGLATMGNSGGLYMGGGATYPNPIIQYNYIDATGTGSSVCIFSDGQLMNGPGNQGDPAWLANGTNYSLTSGNKILTWNSNCQ